MVLIIILTCIAALLIAFSLAAVTIGGAAFIVIFSDVIVCAAIIGWIIYKLTHRKK